MTIGEQIAQIVEILPKHLAREVLDFVCFLQARERLAWTDWQNAQAASLAHVWDNAADDVWNDLSLR